jgi:uncharacterized protein (TIGR03437 family)
VNSRVRLLHVLPELIRQTLVLLALGFLFQNGLGGQQATPPVITEYTLPAAGSPEVITPGPDGNLWFSLYDQIGKITPGGTITEYQVSTDGANVASYMTAGTDGKVWYTESALRKIASVTMTGTVTEYPLPQGTSAYGITVGPDGNIWFTDDLQQHVGRIDSTGTITEFSIQTGGPPYSFPMAHGITTGPDGNLWFAEYGASKIGRVTTSGVLTEYPLPVANSFPECITLGPDGNLWFTEQQRSVIGKITPNGAITEYPLSLYSTGYMMTRGPDGALWFTENGANNIGRIATSGEVLEIGLPTIRSFPYGIAAGADGNIWFTEQSTNRIGKVVLSNPVPTGPVTLSQSSLTFNEVYFSTPPPPQTFTVSAPAPTSFTVTVNSDPDIAGSTPWLTISPSGVLSTDQTITVGIAPDVLLPGSYSGPISILAGGVTQTVQVTLNVAPTTGGNVYTNLGLLEAVCTIGSVEPCMTELDIFSQASSTQKNSFVISTAVTAPTGSNWLSLLSITDTVVPSGSTGVTPYTVEVSLNPKGMTAGAYTGIVTIAPTDGAVVRVPVTIELVSSTTQAPIVQAVVNSASFAPGGVSPGEIVTIYGTGLGPDKPLGVALDSSGKLATSLGGVLVSINGTPAPLIYVSSTQINCVVPYEAAGAPFLTADVLFLVLPSNSYQAVAVSAAPGIFTLNGTGGGPGAILNSTGVVNGPNNPAAQGSTVTIFLTGEGQTDPAGVTGAITTVNTSSGGPLTPQPLSEPVVTIGGATALVSFYGEAPGLVSGVLQINAIIPSGLPSGDLPLIVSIAGVASQPGVTVSVQ